MLQIKSNMFGFKKLFTYTYKEDLKNIIKLEKQRIINELETGFYETNEERSVWEKDFNPLESKLENLNLNNVEHKRLLEYIHLLKNGSLEEIKLAVIGERKLEQQRIKNEKEYGYFESDEEIESNEESLKNERINLQKEDAVHKTKREKLEREINYTETGYFETNLEREAREDQEIINNNKNFKDNRTNDQFINLFQKYDIDLNFSKKRLLEKQINGELPIEELPVEFRDNQKNELRKLNEIGVWFHIGQRRLIKFPKTDDDWGKITGRKLRNHNSGYSYFDGTRGFDDWASK